MSDDTGTGWPPDHGGFEPVRGASGQSNAARPDPAPSGAGATGPTPSGTGSTDPGPDNDATHASGRRSKKLKILVIVIVVVVLGALGALAAVLLSRAGVTTSQPTPTATVTVTAPPPTATVAPVDVPAGSDFWNALPHTVDAFVVAAAEPAAPGSSPILTSAAGSPLEAYTWTYTNGDQQILLTATQWATADEAATTFTAVAADAGTTPEPVDVGGIQTGSVVRTAAEDEETIAWSNGTAVFQVVGPEDVADQFYAQFPF